jgi:hypothetical protein
MCPPIDTTRLSAGQRRWGEIRQRGLFRFVFLYFTVGWGLSWAVLFSVLFAWLVRDRFLAILPMALALGPIGGTLAGLWLWRSAERDYLKATDAAPERAGT